MDAITIYEPQEITGQGFADIETLINNFVVWIDRSETTTRTYINNLRQFVAFLKYEGITTPGRDEIILYRQWLQTEHDAIKLDPDSVNGWKYRTDRNGNRVKVCCKPNTVALYLRSVAQLFKWAATEGYYTDIAANIHAPKISHDNHRKEALTPAEVLAIEKSIAAGADAKRQQAQDAEKDTAGRMQRSDEQGKRLLAIYLLTVNNGLRTIEISRANIKDYVKKNGRAYLYIWGKGRTEADQKKPLAKEVADAIDAYLQSRTDNPTGASPLFVATGNRSRGKRIATTTISTMLKRAMQAAGFDSEKITAHSLRHTTGTNVQEMEGNLYTTQKYMRHANPATTEIYLHNDTEKQEAGIAQRLYNYYHGKAETDSKDKLQAIIDRLTPAKMEQLAGIAAAMA